MLCHDDVSSCHHQCLVAGECPVELDGVHHDTSGGGEGDRHLVDTAGCSLAYNREFSMVEKIQFRLVDRRSFSLVDKDR